MREDCLDSCEDERLSNDDSLESRATPLSPPPPNGFLSRICIVWTMELKKFKFLLLSP